MAGQSHNPHTVRGDDQGRKMVRHGGMRGGCVHSVNRLQHSEFVLNNGDDWRAYLPSWMRIERDVSRVWW